MGALNFQRNYILKCISNLPHVKNSRMGVGFDRPLWKILALYIWNARASWSDACQPRNMTSDVIDVDKT